MAALMTEYVYNQYQLADALGKSPSSVSKTISLNKLPEEIRDAYHGFIFNLWYVIRLLNSCWLLFITRQTQ